MKADRKEFLAALQWVGKACPKRANLPILENVRLESKDGYLTLAATNLEIAAERTLPADGELPPQLLEHRALLQIAKSAKSEDIEIGNKIKAGNRSYDLPRADIEEYPEFPKAAYHVATLDCDLSDILKRVELACGTDPRFSLEGFLFEVSKQGLNIIATDGKQLYIARIGEPAEKEFMRLIVPHAAASFNGWKSPQFYVNTEKEEDRNLLQIRDGNSSLTLRLTEGKFPDWRSILIKDEPAASWIFDPKELEEEIKALAVVMDETTNMLKFDIKEGQAILSAGSKSRGKATSTIRVADDGEGKFGLNPNYLLDAIKATTPKGEKTTISYWGSDRPIHFASTSEIEAIVMPLTD